MPKFGGIEPAFPNNDPHGPQGMSLRDYFAAHAMTLIEYRIPRNQELQIRAVPEMASLAYKIADAMMAQRALSNSERTDG